MRQVTPRIHHIIQIIRLAFLFSDLLSLFSFLLLWITCL